MGVFKVMHRQLQNDSAAVCASTWVLNTTHAARRVMKLVGVVHTRVCRQTAVKRQLACQLHCLQLKPLKDRRPVRGCAVHTKHMFALSHAKLVKQRDKMARCCGLLSVRMASHSNEGHQ